MPDNRKIVLIQEHSDTQNEEIREADSLEQLILAYDQLLSGVKVRTYHVLTDWRQSFPDDRQFFERLFSASQNEILGLRCCGRLTLNEITSLREQLCGFCRDEEQKSTTTTEPDEEKILLPANIDELLPLFLSTIDGLSARAANRVHSLLKECGNSLSAFYDRISDPDCIKNIPTIGCKSTPELIDFFAKSKLFLRSFPDENSVSARVRHHQIISPAALGLPGEAIDYLREKEASLGYFPLFAAIKIYFENRPKEEKVLFDGCLLIHKDRPLPGREEVAATLHLTPERVRQKRNKLIGRLPAYFKTYRSLGFITDNPYRYQMTRVEDEINAAEGTDFNLNFVSWVLGSTFGGLSLVGDPVKAIGGFFDTEQYLCIVPTYLTALFDFEAFIRDLDERMQEKRVDEEKVKLQSLINAHLKVQYCEEHLPDIETTCRTILYLHFPVEIDLGDVILPSNSYKTNTFIVEDILRKAGRPMTFDEIYEEYRYQYPERDTTESSLRGAIGTNRNIVPIGRTSTYALKAWNHIGEKGGTVRGLVSEYLDGLEEPIAPVADVCEYVRRFQPGTSESSISGNLKLDKGRKFQILSRNGIRYYGYSDRDYGCDFKQIGGRRCTKRPVQESMRILVEFILRERRYPVNNPDDEEESRLYRFVCSRRSACARAVVPQEEIEQWLAFEEKYRSCGIAPRRRRKCGQTELKLL